MSKSDGRLAAERLASWCDDLVMRSERVAGDLCTRAARREPKHRLVRLRAHTTHLAAIFRAIASGTIGKKEGSLSSMGELAMHVRLLEEAKEKLANWDQIVSGCSNPQYYDHFILTLAVQSVFRDNWGLKAELVPEQATKTADLLVSVGNEASLAVEVKSKLALVDPSGLLPYDHAHRIIKAAIGSTGSSESGQLQRGQPGVLVIGGFFISTKQIELLKKAAADWFRRHPRRRKSLAGIMVVSVMAYLRDDHEGSMMPATDVAFTRNPAYDLDLEIVGLTSGKPIEVDAAFRRWEADFEITPPSDIW